MAKAFSHCRLLPIIFFIIIALSVFFGGQFFTKTGFFKPPGKVYYDPSLTTTEIENLQTIFTKDLILKNDVTITATTTLTKPEPSSHTLIHQILVPVTDFYDSTTSLPNTTILSLATDFFSEQTSAPESSSSPNSYPKLLPISKLSPTEKLLAIDDDYYLDSFERGAIFRNFTFDSKTYETEIKPLVSAHFQSTFPDSSTVLTFAETGVTALSRGMNKKLKQVGNAEYFAENIKSYLSNFDLTHISNESSFSNSASYTNICSDPHFIETLIAIGVDIVELTGNHNQDCGDESARNTIDTYLSHNIKLVGGGKTATEAKIPLTINQKNTHITMLAYNQSTGGATLDQTPGANQYNEEDAKTNITTAKKRGDIVIVNIQYYECSNYDHTSEHTACDKANSSAGDQISFFRHLIDLGADIVVGTSAHQPQTFETYKGKTIYYGLGNLFFDQVWWPGTTRSLILAHYFYQGKHLQTKIVPTVYDNNMQTRLMNKEQAQWFLKRLASVHP